MPSWQSNAFRNQYGKLEIKYTDEFHDRFLILDSKALYHIGASIKDAGKKAFEISPNEDGKLLESLLSRLYPLPNPFHHPAPQTDAP